MVKLSSYSKINLPMCLEGKQKLLLKCHKCFIIIADLGIYTMSETVCFDQHWK